MLKSIEEGCNRFNRDFGITGSCPKVDYIFWGKYFRLRCGAFLAGAVLLLKTRAADKAVLPRRSQKVRCLLYEGYQIAIEFAQPILFISNPLSYLQILSFPNFVFTIVSDFSNSVYLKPSSNLTITFIHPFCPFP